MSREKLDEVQVEIDRRHRSSTINMLQIHNDILRDLLDKQPGEQQHAPEGDVSYSRLGGEQVAAKRIAELEAENERLQQQLATEQNRSGHLDADVKELRQDLEEVNEFARSLGHGQGTIDNGLVDCLRASFAKYEQLRRLVREFQNARSCRVKWGDVMPANISVYGQVFANRDEYKRFGDAVTQLSGVVL